MSGPRFVQSSHLSTNMQPSRSSSRTSDQSEKSDSESSAPEDLKASVNVETRSKWTLGILRDKETDSVPGSVFLLSGAEGTEKKNAPLGLKHLTHKAHATSTPSQSPAPTRNTLGIQSPTSPLKKRTADGAIILDPQPDDTKNDPLNWTASRRNTDLLSLGLYCLLGGGGTPILAAGFTDVAETYHTTVPKVALTTGLFMLGMGVGGVLMSPTAILFGKRPVYLATAIMFIATSIWCAASPSFVSLQVARVFQGIAVSPTEVLPSASIAEIFFLHERAYRLGIYTLLLLSGKNLIPLASAAIIESMSWRWVFYIYAICIGFAATLVFFLCPETFWDRAPRPQPKVHRDPNKTPGRLSRQVSAFRAGLLSPRSPRPNKEDGEKVGTPQNSENISSTPNLAAPAPTRPGNRPSLLVARSSSISARFQLDEHDRAELEKVDEEEEESAVEIADRPQPGFPAIDTTIARTDFADVDLTKTNAATTPSRLEAGQQQNGNVKSTVAAPSSSEQNTSVQTAMAEGIDEAGISKNKYTAFYQKAPIKSYLSTLKPYDGHINEGTWWRLALRPFVLYSYPAILWAAAVYSLSIGWLIVLSESVAHIYRTSDTYNFSALQAGLVYISPFIGAVLGTAVAGKLSDVVVKFMTRKNEGLYEPEFRLLMAIPVTIATTIGLMAFGWSAQEHDAWIVPTVFFGIISFGCSLGSTTAITFAVDSYRMYAAEALVTLNFSKNIFHGLVFSLFFTGWLEHDGSRDVFLVLGGIQLAFLITTVPMYVYGKRARMWTTRKDLVGKIL